MKIFEAVVSFFQYKTAANTRHQSYSLIEIASTGHCSGVRSAGHGTHRRLKEPCQNQIPAQRTKHGRRNTAWNRTPLRLMVVFCMTKLTKLTNYRNLVKLVKLVTWNFWGSCNANDIALFALLALWMHKSAKVQLHGSVYEHRFIPSVWSSFRWRRFNLSKLGTSWITLPHIRIRSSW